MISLLMTTPHELLKFIANQAHLKRLSLNLSQKTLSEKSAVSFGVIKKFERTGKISLESLLKIALALDALDEFKELFKSKPLESLRSIDELLAIKQRKRGRK